MKHRVFFIVFIAVACLVWGIVFFGLFQGIERGLSDRLFLGKPLSERIIIVAIDDASLTALGQWPLPRSIIAAGLQNLISSGPRAIGIDIVFSEPSRLGQGDDAALAAVFRESVVPIVLPVEAQSVSLLPEPRTEGVIRTLPEFTGPNISVAHINLIQDRDGLVRRLPFTLRYGDESFQSFALKVTGSSRSERIGTIVWSGAPGTVPRVSLKDLVSGDLDPLLFKDAYVFVGATAANLHDEQTTPVSRGTPMAGVEIQAQVANMLLGDYRLMPVSFSIFLVWLFILIAVPAALFLYVRRIAFAIAGTLLLLFLNIVAVIVSFEYGMSVPIVHTSLAGILSGLSAFSVRYFILDRERREIRSVFSKYVSRAVLEELLKNPEKVKLGGEEAVVTIFFSDVRGFTTLSEKLSPSQLTHFLNRYLTAMTDIILANDGVVDKYIGDAIMAFWGAPLKNDTHAKDAVRSSLLMLEALDAFNKKSSEEGHPTIDIGIGLSTGTVVVGNMGSTQRFDYTIMGDAVNLGSRIEGQTKTYGVRLLASEHVVSALGEGHGFLIREIDRIIVKGKETPVALYEIVEGGREAFVRSILSDFKKVLSAYYAGNWHETVSSAESVLEKGSDGPTQAILARARHFLSNAPESWNGVYEFTTK